MVDEERVIYEYLDTSSLLTDAIGTNIFVNTVYDFDGSQDKGIRFRIKGGKTQPYCPLHILSIDFFCYGGSNNDDESRLIYRLLHDRLHGITNVKTESGWIVHALETNFGQTYREPDTDWITTFTNFQVAMRQKGETI